MCIHLKDRSLMTQGNTPYSYWESHKKHTHCAAKYRAFYGSTYSWTRTSGVRRLTNCIRCVPSCQSHAYWVGSQDELGRQNDQEFEGSYTVLFTFCYIKLYAHIQNCWMTSTMESAVISWHCLMFKLYKKKIRADYGYVMFLISPVSSSYDLTKILSSERVLMK